MGEKSKARLALEKRAVDLGVKFPKNIGDDKLTARIAEAEAPANGPEGGTNTSENVAADQGKSGARVPSLGPDAKSGLVVIVTGPGKGRWRIGRLFGAEPVEIPLGELTEDEQAALIADSSLTVSTQPAATE